ILDLVDDHAIESINPDSTVLRELVERAIRVKIDVVTADLRETGGTNGHPGREALNYGHTLAHAIERNENYRIRHGEAVAIGCVYVAELAARAGTLAPEVVERHHQAFAKVGLPTTYSKASFDDLHRAMKVDKKSRGSQLRFVVLTDIAQPTVLAGPSLADLRDAYTAIGGRK
ncbi:MAG: 3-dehydroquinate synthase, partial [Actinomycetales bacterium]